MDSSWSNLFEILVLLTAALLLGTLAESLRQSALLGYLVAGTLVGPHVFGLVKERDHVEMIAELGVALLLFSIGLEFSVTRLRRLGRIALIGGSTQIVLTIVLGASVSLILGLTWRASLAVGSIITLSSTACVLRLLIDRAAIDSLYGRRAVAILLMQDLAVIPLMLLMVLLAGGGTLQEAVLSLGRSVALVVVLVGVFFALLNYVVPRLLNINRWSRNRELPILLAIVLALGSAWAAHAVSLSPAMGAFLAGALLGASPFAVQIRADIGSLKTVLVTLFFASIGMLGDPQWAFWNWPAVAAAVVVVVAGKALIAGLAMRATGAAVGIAAATALCVAQCGEFSFVLANMARGSILDEHAFRLIISVTIVSLFATPFMVSTAPVLSGWITRTRSRRRGHYTASRQAPALTTTDYDQAQIESPPSKTQHRSTVYVIGFGPAGQAVAAALTPERRKSLCVIDLNARNAVVAERNELRVQIGDASHRDVLEHAGIEGAEVIVVTVPDPATSRLVIHHCKSLAPNAAIIARARYHVVRWDLQLAGAQEVVDEEEEVGKRLAEAVQECLDRQATA